MAREKLKSLDGILFPKETMSFLKISFEQYAQDTFELAGKIEEAKIPFDSLVGIEKGGLFVYQFLADLLKIKKIGTIKVVRTAAGSFSLEKFTLEKPINIDVKGDTVLLVDDVADQGSTFRLGEKHLKARGAKRVLKAAPYVKPSGIKVTSFSVILTESWILFPTDLRENIEVLYSRWQDSGLNDKEITQRLGRLDYRKEEISRYKP